MVKVILPAISVRLISAQKYDIIQIILIFAPFIKLFHLENTDFAAIADQFSTSRKILITTHTNPDGDAIGASLALARYLRKKNHIVRVMAPDPFPDFLAWMPGCGDYLIFTDKRDECITAIREADMIIAADFNNLSRLNEAEEFVRQSGAIKVLIDHHLYASDIFDLKISI